ncbi:thiamine pyrophosphate-binding protein [Pseudooceanicola sp. 216_PA32_1]|uniref:Thiamine pyrophosphate-binding protein n=1 Tax=Pseudooceanicola pacificus TaxID=2676438 RepID=A0A844W2F6_9RHOB|nr:thiamine pyrophosphate-binding protein [Pseudooceanicola pacificus]MWB77275.1 thiamine pyrophosphate-binding protein [Pseudooceanicola pacificus]
MKDTETTRHAGALLVECLAAQGVERVFSIPGESFLAALDGLHDSAIRVVTARQEGGAAMMAEATGKMTGKPGVAFVTRGPGATNASSGVHVAFQDSTPMILFVGDVASDQRDREAFQEVDFHQMFGPLAKWAARIDRADRIPEYVSRAFHVAQSGRPGPVVLALPEDMLSSTGVTGVAAAPAVIASGKAAGDDIAAILDRLQSAESPVCIVGGGGWSGEAAEALGRLALALDMPVGASFRCQDYLDNRHPAYAGDVGIGINPALAQRVREADVILALGARLGEMTTSGYTLLSSPQPDQALIHVHGDPNEHGRVYRPEIAVTARPGPLALQLADAAEARGAVAATPRCAAARAAYTAWQQPESTPRAIRMEHVVSHMNEVLGDDAVVTNGAGNYAGWVHRYYRYRGWRTQLAPTSGSMGYGLPAAIAAKLERPESDVICMAGDGCFQMVSQEFGTACAEGANVIVILCDNGMYGTIRMHQQKHYPRRPSGTALKNPDFAALARAHGGLGLTVETDADFAPALAEARAAGVPAILHLKLDPRALSTKLVLED